MTTLVFTVLYSSEVLFSRLGENFASVSVTLRSSLVICDGFLTENEQHVQISDPILTAVARTHLCNCRIKNSSCQLNRTFSAYCLLLFIYLVRMFRNKNTQLIIDNIQINWKHMSNTTFYKYYIIVVLTIRFTTRIMKQKKQNLETACYLQIQPLRTGNSWLNNTHTT